MTIPTAHEMSLETELREYFGEDKKRVVLVGVGNSLRGDDGVGVKIIELLEMKNLPDILLLNTETVPEAFTDKVTDYKPTHILLLDAANFHGSPGETKLIASDKIGGHAISTHSLPLNIFISYLEYSTSVKTLLLGIQPRNIDFYSEMTPEVLDAAVKVSEMLYRILKK